MEDNTILLYRPAGSGELELIKYSGYKEWLLKLEGHPIFYPETNEKYARLIAREWQVKESGAGYITRFRLKKTFLDN